MCTVYSVEYTVVDVNSVQCTRLHLAPSVVEVYTVHCLQLAQSDVDVYNVQLAPSIEFQYVQSPGGI